MAFDGIVTKSIIVELNESILNGKINKVFEPNKNEIILGIYSAGKNYALNCSICSDNYRINLTTHSKPNPLNAPGFCMLLRKHLIGGKIVKIYNPGLERIVVIELECYSELNDLITKKLVIELMGKHSNIILLNEKDIIIDSLRHLDSSNNSLRDILPAHPYVLPTSNKLDLYSVIDSFDKFYEVTKDLDPLDVGISDTFTGISRLFMQNVLEELNINNVNNTNNNASPHTTTTITKENLQKIYNYLFKILHENTYLKYYKSDYTATTTIQPSNSDLHINFFIDDFYTKKETSSQFYSYRNTLLKLVDGTLKRITKKLNNINSKLKECTNKDVFKLYGELITANLYKFSEFTSDYIELENYYDNNNIIKIPVDKHLSPTINAKNYFKKYDKLKNALQIVNKQKLETVEELNYIETIIYSLDNAKDINDIDEIYSEMQEFTKTGNSKNKISVKSSRTKNTNKKADKEYIPIEYKIEGYTFLIGKNNKQNDYLSTKTLKRHDIWFHTKEIHSSHGILQTNNTTPSIDVIIRCAQIIAYYSKARQSSNVPVDYALGQYVKKPSGSKPGMVIYTHNSTVNVQPKK